MVYAYVNHNSCTAHSLQLTEAKGTVIAIESLLKNPVARGSNMGFFFGSKKDPAQDYEKNKKAFKDKIAVARNKDVDLALSMDKCEQSGQMTRMYVQVKQGCMKVGDLLEVTYKRNNKLGLFQGVGQVMCIYQVHGTGRDEKLVQVDEAYEQDNVWIDLSGIDANLVEKNPVIRRTKAKGVVAAEGQDGAITVSSDMESSQAVNRFKTEMHAHFAENKPISFITQDLGYSLQAQKRRLDRMGITMIEEPSSDAAAAAMKMEVGRYSSGQFDVAEANEPVKLKRAYVKSGQVVYQDEDWAIRHYLLAGAKQTGDGNITCPNCSNVAPREELLTGCPYCNTQFTIQDLSLRVAGYSQKVIEQSAADKRQGKIDIGYALYSASGKNELDQVMQHRMKQVDPLFSASAFYNSMRNKLYTIVFAENEGVLKNLADEDFDVAPFYGKFSNVIDLDIQGIKTKDFKANGKYILTDVVMDVLLLRYREDAGIAEWSKETVTLSFVKHVDNKTKNVFEPSMIQCKTCGGSYSLYEGKACSYCGNEIDYLMYDWSLIDMSVK